MSETEVRARRIAQYQSQKAGHDHEWTILVSRMAAYLTSQSLFATGAALLESSHTVVDNHDKAMGFMSFMGAFVSILASIYIAINCRVIIEWHRQIQSLIYEDKISGNHVEGMYMPRGQPDWMHIVSVDVYNILITIIGGTSWLFILGTPYPVMIVPSAVIIVLWVPFVLFLYFFSAIPAPKK